MEDKTLEAVIKIRNEMSKELQDIQKELKQLNNTSDEVNSAMKDIEKATGNAGDALNDLSGATKETNDTLKDTGGAAEEAARGITGMALQEAGQKMMEFGSKIVDVVKNLLDLTEATKEFNSLQGKLQGSTKQNGYKQANADKNAEQVYGYTGDEMMAVNVVSNLQKMGLTQKELDKTIGASLAVWTAYGDSIPIESLTESITETAQVGKVTGNLADALNWAGISEDDFNKKLEACKTTSERNKLITDALNATYGESKQAYDEANSAMIDYNKSLWESQQAQAELGSALAPLNSAINGIKSSLAEALAPVIQQIADAIQPVIQKIQEFIQEHPKLAAGIAIAVAAIMGLIGVIGAILVIVGGAIIAFTGLGAIAGVLAGVMGFLCGPVLMVIMVITALVAIGKALYDNWDTIKAKAIEVWNTIVTTVTTTCQAIWNTITSVWNSILSTITGILESIRSFVVEKWNAIKQAVQDAVNAAKDTVQTAFDNIREKVMGVIDEIKGAWESFKSVVTKPITATVNFIKNAVGGDDGQGSAFGTNYVPKDNMLFRLHQGEAVLPRRDADQWRKGKTNTPNISIVMNGTVIREEADIKKMASELVRKINQQKIIIG